MMWKTITEMSNVQVMQLVFVDAEWGQCTADVEAVTL